MATTLKEMMEAANSAVPRIGAAEAAALSANGKAVIVDVRDGAEVMASGKVKGAIHISRGLLEFKADPHSPAHDQALDPNKTVILYCSSGGRSALAGKTLLDLGYKDVRNLGAFKDWAAGGGAVEKSS